MTTGNKIRHFFTGVAIAIGAVVVVIITAATVAYLTSDSAQPSEKCITIEQALTQMEKTKTVPFITKVLQKDVRAVVYVYLKGNDKVMGAMFVNGCSMRDVKFFPMSVVYEVFSKEVIDAFNGVILKIILRG